jgi:twitching motility protein PilJ
MAYLFYDSLKKSVEAQIQETLSSKVNLITTQMKQAEVLTSSLASSVSALHRQGVENPQTYKELIFELFKHRPDFVIGLGIGQSEFGVLPKQQWFFPYFMVDSGSEDAYGQLLPPPHDNIRYIDENEPGDFYPEADYWLNYFVPQKTVWADPYEYGGTFYTTFYTPIYDARGKWLGGASLDFDAGSFNQSLQGKVVRDAGYFALLTEGGQIISYPSAPAKGLQANSYREIPELKAVWNLLKKGRAGIVQKQGHYWVYGRVPTSNWIVLASVPTSVVLAPVLWIAVGGTVMVGLLLAAVVSIAILYLNRRLQPILVECQKLAATDEQTQAQMARQDEIGRLSTSFFNLLKQLAANEEKMRQEVARTIQAQEQLRQAADSQAESEVLQTEVGHILEIVSAVEEGDLTVQAQVSDRATGLVADTLNRLIEELASVISTVLSTAKQVTQGASELKQLAVNTAEQAQEQTHSVVKVQTLMQKVTDLSQQNVEQNLAADEAIQQAQTAVSRGEQEMTMMNERIGILGQGAGQIVKRVENLTNFMQLTAQFTREQKRVAALTRVLALNASKIAFRASAQPDPEQFASIAREFDTISTQVNDLAFKTNEGLILLQQRTEQMQTVMSGLDRDVKDIERLVNDFTTGVGQSRQVFDQIKTVTEQVALIEQKVTQSSQAIATAAQTTLRSVQNIAAIAAETENQAYFTSEQSAVMEELARSLLQLVQFFRVSSEAQSDCENLIIAPDNNYPDSSTAILPESVSSNSK